MRQDSPNLDSPNFVSPNLTSARRFAAGVLSRFRALIVTDVDWLLLSSVRYKLLTDAKLYSSHRYKVVTACYTAAVSVTNCHTALIVTNCWRILTHTAVIVTNCLLLVTQPLSLQTVDCSLHNLLHYKLLTDTYTALVVTNCWQTVTQFSRCLLHRLMTEWFTQPSLMHAVDWSLHRDHRYWMLTDCYISVIVTDCWPIVT